MKEHSNYHKFLRVSAVVLAFVLIFESGLLIESTKQLSIGTHQYLANAVGMSASIKPNELNRYTAALTQKEKELAEREAALRDREIAVNLSTGSSNNSADRSTYILASILFIILVLIILNYVLDYLRLKEIKQQTVQTV
jgi:preprotein translocase subunit SecG